MDELTKMYGAIIICFVGMIVIILFLSKQVDALSKEVDILSKELNIIDKKIDLCKQVSDTRYDILTSTKPNELNGW